MSGKRTFLIDKDLLGQLYINQRLTTSEVGLKLGHDERTIARHLAANGIKIRAAGVPKGHIFGYKQIAGLDRKTLVALYSDQWLTAQQIADKFGCSQTAVLNAIKRYELPTHKSKVRGMTSENLSKLYLDRKWSTIRIANHFGYKSDETIRKALKKHGIPVRTRGEAAKNKLLSPKERARLKTHFKDLGLTGSGSKHPAWKGGFTKNLDGYILKRVEGKYVLEHRWIMSQHLGYTLEPWEEVNHINGIKTDNRLENLEVIYSEHKHKDELRRRKANGEAQSEDNPPKAS